MLIVYFLFQVSRDPRFDDLSGKFNENMFEKAYSFLDDITRREMEVSEYKILHLRRCTLSGKSNAAHALKRGESPFCASVLLITISWLLHL